AAAKKVAVAPKPDAAAPAVAADNASDGDKPMATVDAATPAVAADNASDGDKPMATVDAATPAVAADNASDGDKPVATVDAATPYALLVRTKKGVARRCRSGFEFGPEAKAVPLDDLSQEQLEAILNDPLLEVPQPDADSEEAAA
ncbi:MAG: hypothetical protein Q7K57_25120, partial [Burkholderiaceae bacterium]|nr:hypothetical protein [Burkholderiaceae bacterium]